MEESLEDRLKSHAQAFDGLLSLIPAENYYNEQDKSEPWQRKPKNKEQTKEQKEQAKAAKLAGKLAKLDPVNARTARDLLDERERGLSQPRKRKRDDDGQEEDADDTTDVIAGLVREKPMEGIKRQKVKKASKEDANKEISGGPVITTKPQTKQSDANSKAALKQAKQSKKKEKLDRKPGEKLSNSSSIAKITPRHQEEESLEDEASNSEHELPGFDGQDFDDASSSSSSPSKPPSPIFDLPNTISGTSSIASTATIHKDTSEGSAGKSLPGPESSTTQEEHRARLHARIAELRQARKADGVDGKPARSRTELIEQRRKKLEQRKATKKALREQAKAEERRLRDEALARGSPLITPGTMSPLQPSSPMTEAKNNFSFSRMQFDNGQVMSADLSTVHGQSKKSASNTISKTALEALEKQQGRLADMIPEQRAAAKEKDTWINANKRAQGQRVKDDTSLLKKALKRKEGKKKKSTKEWDARLTGVANAQAAKQKRREDNIAQRREDKLNKGKTGKKGGSKNKKKKLKARPGFEGSFKTGGARRK